MANKRNLKKQVRYICGDLAAECLLAAEYIKDVDCVAMHNVVTEIAQLQTVTLANVSFSFDKVLSDFETGAAYRKARRDYNRKAYAVLRTKFNDKMQEIVKAMNAAIPQAVKDANKTKA